MEGMEKLPPSGLVNAWFDYWTRPNDPLTSIAQRHSLNYSSVFRKWAEWGLTARRSNLHMTGRDITSQLLDEHCEGFGLYFCAECPVEVYCDDWHCTACKIRRGCACMNPELRPKDWPKKLGAFKRKLERNNNALNLYRYAWVNLEAAKGELNDN